MPQTTKPGCNVQRDKFVRATAGEPGPGSVDELIRRQFLQSGANLAVHPVVFKQVADIAAGLALLFRFQQPGSFLDHQRLQVLIFLERTVERVGPAPLFEDPFDLGITVGDVLGQGVGIQPIERLLIAFVRKLHQVGQGEDRVPGRIAGDLDRQTFLDQRIGLDRFGHSFEIKFASLIAANRQRQRFLDKHAFAENRQKRFLAVRKSVRGSDDFVSQDSGAVGNRQLPGNRLRLS